MLVITGPTGQIGSQVLAHLLSGTEPIRIIARDPAKVPAQVRDKVQIVQGSYAESDVVMEAFDGADAVLWVPIASPTAQTAEAAFADMSRPAAEAIRRCAVKHVISVSALGRGWPKSAGHASASIRMDDMLAESGANFRALACPTLMDNMLRQAALIRNQNMFSLPVAADFRAPQVATRDVAAAAAALLRDRSWSGARDLALLGPADISAADQARIMSEVLGKSITFREMPIPQLKTMMLGRGASEGMAQAMVDMAVAKKDGMDNVIPRTSDNTTPTSFRTWCTDVLRPAL